MISEYHFYHGAALSILVSRTEFTGLSRIPDLGSAYAVNNAVGLYIKHASRANGPWQFTFAPDHQREVRELFQKFNGKTFIALVCGRRGICLLEYGEYAATLPEVFKNQRVLIVRRPSGGGFRVSGGAGKLKGVISSSRYPNGLFASKHK
jgi:hypothetical protein